jgi:Rps23 Pro-64 3,4-dihydroxylase Tpa1-like proline 4-hydroxylase
MSEIWLQRTRVVAFDEFLVAQEWAGLLQYALRRGGEFTEAGVLDSRGASRTDDDYRRSQVLYDLDNFQNLFIDRITGYLPHLLARLHMAPFPVSRFEIQLTAINDGQFFKMHKDDDSDSVRSRAITFVYYFYREPKAFRGGALRLYDAQLDPDGKVSAGSHQNIHPMQNQVVFFPSDCLHEVLPVDCPSRDYADSRFTVNGWVHR